MRCEDTHLHVKGHQKTRIGIAGQTLELNVRSIYIFHMAAAINMIADGTHSHSPQPTKNDPD